MSLILLKGSAITLGIVALVQGGIYLCGKHKEKKEMKAQEEARKEMANKIKAAIPPIEDAPRSSAADGCG